MSSHRSHEFVPIDFAQTEVDGIIVHSIPNTHWFYPFLNEHTNRYEVLECISLPTQSDLSMFKSTQEEAVRQARYLNVQLERIANSEEINSGIQRM